MSITVDLNQLAQLTARPPLFAQGEDLWRDPHISIGMLESHLDPTHDMASRRPETIDATVAWLLRALHLEPGDSLLDLGCGPGLYCQRFAAAGLRVTGVDYSPRSVAHARSAAAAAGLEIEYLCADYLELAWRDRFDAAVLIYYDLGALSDTHRQQLLERVRLALKPGGRFAVDVQAPAARTGAESATWSLYGEPGFWSPRPHLLLTQQLRYAEASAWLDQYVVLDPDGARVFRVWERHYSEEDIRAALEAVGLGVEHVGADLAGGAVRTPVRALGLVARRQG